VTSGNASLGRKWSTTYALSNPGASTLRHSAPPLPAKKHAAAASESQTALNIWLLSFSSARRRATPVALAASHQRQNLY
jgi:hypothetical protein